MRTKELISELTRRDPSGEMFVCLNGFDFITDVAKHSNISETMIDIHSIELKRIVKSFFDICVGNREGLNEYIKNPFNLQSPLFEDTYRALTKNQRHDLCIRASEYWNELFGELDYRAKKVILDIMSNGVSFVMEVSSYDKRHFTSLTYENVYIFKENTILGECTYNQLWFLENSLLYNLPIENIIEIDGIKYFNFEPNIDFLYKDFIPFMIEYSPNKDFWKSF